MSLLSLLCLSSLTLVLSGWEAPLESTAKISPEEREQMSKNASASSRKAYAPTKGRIAQFLASDSHMKQACPICGDKDYSDPCPLDWTELSDGRCKAPSLYKGDCNKLQTFLGSTVAAKIELELSCAVCWPCTKVGADATAACVRDFTKPCPYGYTPQDISYNEFREAAGITCAADALFYEGECEQQVLFKDLQAKQEFSERCQTSWPCIHTCQGALTACPNGWQPAGDGLCVAPEFYKVDGCPLLQRFRGWTNAMKIDFAHTCGVDWLCSQNVKMDEEYCQELDFSSCPQDWITKDGTRCAPSPDAQGVCVEAARASGGVEMASMSTEQKIRWSTDCGIEWPCKGETAAAESLGEPRAPAHADADHNGPIRDESSHIAGA